MKESIRQLMVAHDVPDYYIWSFEKFLSHRELEGRSVLEIGGSALPSELIEALGVSSWTSVDIIGHDSGSYQQTQFADHYASFDIKPISRLDATCLSAGYTIFDGDFNLIPGDVGDCFDIIISVNAFEHILDLPGALARMHRVLTGKGAVLTSFGPIWSCAYGSHFWVDGGFNFVNENHAPMPEHAHLLMSPPELFDVLLKAGKSFEVVANAVQQVYHSSFINRLFYDDYLAYFARSDFESFGITPIYRKEIDGERLDRLRMRYPGRSDFETYSIVAVLQK